MAAAPIVDGAFARRPYRPQAHPGRRDRWSKATILAALRDWAVQTGHPPKRQDWSGERPARASDGQRRWMREHPRWPSSSCVARHFGSWSAALEQAGLDARRLTFPSTVAERVTADACRECTRHLPSVARAWSREEALEAIRDWTREHGRPPTYRDWTPSRERPGRWEAESPRWPSAAAVCACYPGTPEPWLSALRDSVGDSEDHVRRLDERRHLRALGEPELLGRLDGDRGHEANAVAVQFDVRRRRAFGDRRDGGGELVARAELMAEEATRRARRARRSGPSGTVR
jgi:hypothetical protein